MNEEMVHALITTYRKTLWAPFTHAVRDYKLVEPGDKIAVCISGGKDSFLLALLMEELRRHGTVPFTTRFLCLDPGYSKESMEMIQNAANKTGIELTVMPADIFSYVESLDQNPCYICARMRRGHLYAAARDLGCNKIALGHHYDDVIETILLSIFYSGKTKTMLPKLKAAHFTGMSLIRPLYYVEEKDVVRFWQQMNVPFIRCACSLTQKRDDPDYEHTSRRAEIKKFIAEYSKVNPRFKQNVFRSVCDVNVETLLSYKDSNGVRHENWDTRPPENNMTDPETEDKIYHR